MNNSTLEFNAVKTIKLINKDTLLKNVFNSNDLEFNQMTLLSKAKTNSLDEPSLTLLNDIFETVIKNRDTYLSEYNKIKATESHPRRYGKRQIDRDIVSQGGQATGTQLTALSVNDLKNMFLTLENKVVSDHYRNVGNISDADGKLVRAAIRTLAKQLEPILKRKK